MMTKDLAKIIRAEVMEAAKAIAAKHGYDVKSGSGSYDDSSYKIANLVFSLSKVEAAAKGIVTAEESSFNFAMSSIGCPAKFGSKFTAPRIGEVSITGYKTSARKYPVIVTDIHGKSYKIGYDVLKRHFGVK